MKSETTSKKTIVTSSWMSKSAISLENVCDLETEKPLRFWVGDMMLVRNLDVLSEVQNWQNRCMPGLRGWPSL